MVETTERVGYESWLWEAVTFRMDAQPLDVIEGSFKETFPGNYTIKITVEKGTIKADLLFEDKHEQLMWMLKYE